MTTSNGSISSYKNPYFWCAMAMLAAFYLISLLTPLWSDDYMFLTVHRRAEGLVLHPVSTLPHMLSTVVDYYLHGTEGRWLNNGLLLHTMLNFTPHALFAAVNTAMWAMLTWCIVRIVVGAPFALRERWHTLMLSGMTLFLLLTARHDTLFWRAGSVNYLWTAVVYLSYYIYISRSAPRRLWVYCVFSFFTGAFSEAFGVPFALYIAYHTLGRRTSEAWAAAACFALGLATVLFAPSTLNRVAESGASVEAAGMVMGLARGFFKNFMSAPTLTLLVAALALGMLRKRAATARFLSHNKDLLVIIAAYVLVFSFLGKNAMRMHFPLALFSFILLARYVRTLSPSRLVQAAKLAVPCAFFIISAMQIHAGAYRTRTAMSEAEMIRRTTDGVVRAEVMKAFTDTANLINRSYAAYYGSPHPLVSLPPAVYDGIYASAAHTQGLDTLRSGVYLDPASKFVVIKLDGALAPMPEIIATYRHKDYGRALAPLLDRAYPPKTAVIDSRVNTTLVRTPDGQSYAVANADDFGFFTEITDITIKQ